MNLKSLTQPEIGALLKELGQPAFRAKQIYTWLHKGVRSYDEMGNIPKDLRQLLDEGRELVLASFCAEEGDEEGIRKILAAMGCENDPRVRILRYDGTNADELTVAIAESGGGIVTRFHAAILAIAAGRPVLPIIYSDKTKHVLEDLGFEGPMYDLREEGTWSTMQMTTATAPAAQAEGHFEKLDAVLGR